MGSENLFHKKKIRKNKELARRKASKAPYETIYIICEDSKSVPQYFKECIQHFKLSTANVIVVPSKGSAPISVVNQSIEIAKNTPGIDCIACVFDHDNHESYDRAIDKIKNHKPKRNDKSKPRYITITSVPCFEIWLLLHFHYTTKRYHQTTKKSASEQLIDTLCDVIPTYTKNTSSWFTQTKDKISFAIKNAEKLTEENRKTKSNSIGTLTKLRFDLNKSNSFTLLPYFFGRPRRLIFESTG